MTLPRKLTIEEERLRTELVQLEERIRMKIRRITLENQKLPYERLAKGRRLKELVLLAIQFLDEKRMVDLGLCIRELRHLGVEISEFTKLERPTK
ncbi:hypothetical protein [Algoriphagus mannitolivorans]|uniref:hypothetical protein n=1 Tax=Algoriphagus mannitolivorans TaxID=226504 RepID=UPI0004059B80|nr:hypothetical protein [Algoriphagus mannitolivorans]